MSRERVDVALVGMGGAGLTMLHELVRTPRPGRPWRVALVDDVDRLAAPRNDRTWCFWDTGPNPADPAVCASVAELRIHTEDRQVVCRPGPAGYRMLRSGDYHRLLAADLAASPVQVLRLPGAGAVRDGPDRAEVVTGAGTVAADWVFDSRPRAPGPHRTWLWQHFLGAFVAVDRAPAHADLMDFRVPQPPDGFAFGYLVPAGPGLLLAEYTAVSRRLLPPGQYRLRLAGYLDARLGPGRWQVREVESGAIPMTDAALPAAGTRVRLTGTAGGATRPSTGYTFRAMQRQAADAVRALAAGQAPPAGAPYPRRARWLDSVMLRAVDRGTLSAPGFFAGLFEQNPPARVLGFLDGTTAPWQDARLVLTAPWGPMIGAVLRPGRPRSGVPPPGRVPVTAPQPEHPR